MRRHLLGLISLVLIVAGVIGFVSGYSSTSPTGAEDAAGVALRAGLLLGAIWIAYPQLVQLAKTAPKWLYAIIAMAAAFFTLGPRSLIIILPALLILGILQCGAWLFKPLPKKRAAKKERQERV